MAFGDDAEAAQLLLSCSSTAFAANVTHPETPRDRLPDGILKSRVISSEMDADAKDFSIGRQPLTVSRNSDASEADVSPTAAPAGTLSPRAGRKANSQTISSRRSTKPLSAYHNLHPVLNLGYKPMCEVHCNGLQGLFLGGHDRDLYIQCTSTEYRDLPLVDTNQGGCIMSCSNFEKVAGRELSKKWKESIHVVGQGEGSKATLLAWLKRQAETMSSDLVGSTVWVCWCNEAEYYLGHIVSFNKENGKHKVKYNERFYEELHLPVEKLSFSATKPQPFAAEQAATHSCPPVARPVLQQDPHTTASQDTFQGFAASPQVAEPASSYTSQQLLHQQHLLHQSSGTSMTSSSTEQRIGFRPVASRKQGSTAPISPRVSAESLRTTFTTGRGRRRSSSYAAAEVAMEREDGMHSPTTSAQRRSSLDFDEHAMPTVPKRLRTGLKEGTGLREGAGPREPHSLRHATSMPGTGRDQQDPQLMEGLSTLAATTSFAPSRSHMGPHDQPPGRPCSPTPLGGLGSLSSVQQLCTLSPPPPTGLHETDLIVMSCWMNKIALQLDDVLIDGVHVLAEPVEAPVLGLQQQQQQQQLGSPSARFQNLLIHARGRGTVPGYYEAMLTRYDHFKDKPATLLLKMVQFVTVVLNEEQSRFSDVVERSST